MYRSLFELVRCSQTLTWSRGKRILVRGHPASSTLIPVSTNGSNVTYSTCGKIREQLRGNPLSEDDQDNSFSKEEDGGFAADIPSGMWSKVTEVSSDIIFSFCVDYSISLH